MKKVTIVWTAVLFMLPLHSVFAGLVINEIMYDLLEGADTGREWVEIYNNSDTLIDLSTFKFFEANTNHGLTIFQGDINIGAHGYAVIVSDHAKFKIDWPSNSLTIFDSSFSLSNAGEALAIKDASLNVVDQYTYSSATGAMGDGNSLQKISGAWVGAMPTPGIANETIIPPPADDSSSSGSSSSGSSGSSSSSSSVSTPETKTKVIETPKIKTQIISKTFGFVGLPLSLQAITYGYQGEQLYSGKYFWNFGDGDSKEIQVTYSQPFTHTYFYPGEYIVSLDYYQNYYSNIPEASSQITIKIIPADISISRVGDEKDFFIELTNNTDYSADLSNWVLASGERSFIIPKNTTLMSKKKIIISSRISNFSVLDKNTLKLLTPEREVAFDYFSSILIPVAVVPAIKSPGGISKLNPDTNTKKSAIAESLVEDLPILPIANTDLSASVLGSGVLGEDIKSSYSPSLIPIAAFFLIGASAGGVYFIRRKKVISSAENDFEILDE